MKIAIVGYSGAGKSTLARKLAIHFDIPVLHLDSVGWQSGWKLRNTETASKILAAFLNLNDAWVIEGNWERFDKGRRYEEADIIVFMNVSRCRCLFQALKRYWQHKGKTRTDMAKGCPEKFDFRFAWWILATGRSKDKRSKYRQIATKYPEKYCELRTHCDIDRFLREVQGLS